MGAKRPLRLVFNKILMPLRQKTFLTFLITHKNQNLKKLCCMVETDLLHSGGTICIADT